MFKLTLLDQAMIPSCLGCVLGGGLWAWCGSNVLLGAAGGLDELLAGLSGNPIAFSIADRLTTRKPSMKISCSSAKASSVKTVSQGAV